MLYGWLCPDAGTCYMLYHTGLPCPLCGGTRALAALCCGRGLEALHYHAPAVILVLGLLILGVRGTIVSEAERGQARTAYLFVGAWGWFWLAWYAVRVVVVMFARG